MSENIIRINNGLKTYSIVDQDDNVLGTIRFNPSDTDIIEKMNGLIDYINTLPDKKPNTSDEFVALQSDVKAKVKEVFGDGITPILDVMGLFSVLDTGEMYLESVLTGIGAIVESETKMRVKKVSERVNQYVKKYKAGPGGYLTPAK